MSAFTPTVFLAELKTHLPADFSGRLCVAFSGGPDSAVLLHVVAELRATEPDWQIRAIHVDHQLQASSTAWASHCQGVADALRLTLIVEKVVVPRDDVQGLESAARTVRYAALKRHLQEGEVLVTAHHADDQAETLLLALLRGSGAQGLAGMPHLKKFGTGWHLRPLLAFTRAQLLLWAVERGIEAVDDPSNSVVRHDRNFVRHEVLPILRTRWPAAATNIARSAEHLGETLSLLDDVAMRDLDRCAIQSCLRIEALRSLSDERCRNLLRYWIRQKGFLAPSTRKLAGLMHDLFNTDLDRIPCVTWQGVELHWHRGILYATKQQPEFAGANSFAEDWKPTQPFVLPAGLGQLSLSRNEGKGISAERLPEILTVRFRRGGERIQLPGRAHHSELKKLLQESDVLPWWRDRFPLIYSNRRLLAIGDLFVSEEFAARSGEPSLRVVWEGAPPWRAVLTESS